MCALRRSCTQCARARARLFLGCTARCLEGRKVCTLLCHCLTPHSLPQWPLSRERQRAARFPLSNTHTHIRSHFCGATSRQQRAHSHTPACSTYANSITHRRRRTAKGPALQADTHLLHTPFFLVTSKNPTLLPSQQQTTTNNNTPVEHKHCATKTCDAPGSL